MPTLLQTVSESILAPGGLSIDDLEPLVGELSVGDVDFADLFFERAEAETYSPHFLKYIGRRALHAAWITQLKCVVGCIQSMATDIAQGSCSVFPKAPPIKRVKPR